MNREIAVSLGQARRDAGTPSYNEIRDRLRDLIGDPTPSIELLRRWHDPDEVPAKRLELEVLVALALAYERPLGTIHPDLAAGANRLRALLDHEVELTRRHTDGYAANGAAPFRLVAVS